MNCSDVRLNLPLLLYGDLVSSEREPVEKHLAECDDCRREYQAFQQVRQMLDSTRAAETSIDLPRLYQEAFYRQARQARLWRGVAMLGAAAAAGLIIALFALRLEVHADGSQLVVRWGTAPAAVAPPTEREVLPVAVQPEAGVPPAVEQRLQLLTALVRAMADGLQSLDERQRQQIEQVHSRMNVAQQQSAQRLAALERNMNVLYMQSQRGE
jgi:anti-sigma factor RsiW